uniref:HDC19406 n=1 Tax=Drosophila melanogaster TaxID=7227 RepID=Q6II89_DROME|nr:TPA_inf: HDC19406 [Drosophila melanogaster]
MATNESGGVMAKMMDPHLSQLLGKIMIKIKDRTARNAKELELHEQKSPVLSFKALRALEVVQGFGRVLGGLRASNFTGGKHQKNPNACHCQQSDTTTMRRAVGRGFNKGASQRREGSNEEEPGVAGTHFPYFPEESELKRVAVMRARKSEQKPSSCVFRRCVKEVFTSYANIAAAQVTFAD